MEIVFEQLQTADLVVDTVYKGGKISGKGSEILSKLMPGCSNSGGFSKVMRKDGSGLPAYALGYYVINAGGENNIPLRIDCALEAKCYSEKIL